MFGLLRKFIPQIKCRIQRGHGPSFSYNYARPIFPATTTMTMDHGARVSDPARRREYLLLLARSHPAANPGGVVEPSDLVQDALADAHRQRPGFRGTTAGEYAAWLRRILSRKLTDAVRAA